MSDATLSGNPAPPSTPSISLPKFSLAVLLFFPLVLAVAYGGHRLGYSIDLFINSPVMDRLITSLLLVLGFSASLLAIRGDTYRTGGAGPWYRRITPQGRLAGAVIVLAFFVGSVKEGRTERSHEKDLATNQETLTRQLTAQKATLLNNITQLQDTVRTLTDATVKYIGTSVQGLDEGQRKDLAARVQEILQGVDQRGAEIKQTFSTEAQQSAQLLQGANANLALLVHPESGVLARLGQNETSLSAKVAQATSALDSAVVHRTDSVSTVLGSVSQRIAQDHMRLAQQDTVLQKTVEDLQRRLGVLERHDTSMISRMDELLLRTARPASAPPVPSAETQRAETPAEPGSTTRSGT